MACPLFILSITSLSVKMMIFSGWGWGYRGGTSWWFWWCWGQWS